MKQSLLFLFASILFFSCKRGDDPTPVAGEVITTARLRFVRPGVDTTFVYAVQNGFNSGNPGTLRADTIVLATGQAYTVSIAIANESVTPAEDITPEIISESADHLFLVESEPATGPGALAFSSGNTDTNGEPFNQTGSITAGAAGSGLLRLFLLHQPTNKNGATPAAAGGDTDVEAAFPVRITP